MTRHVLALDGEGSRVAGELMAIGFAVSACWDQLDPEDPRFRSDPPLDLAGLEAWHETRERLRAMVAALDLRKAALAVEAFGDALLGESQRRTAQAFQIADLVADEEKRRAKGKSG